MQNESEYGPGNQDFIERMSKRPLNIVNLSLVAVNVLVFLWIAVTGNPNDGMHMIDCGASYTPLVIQGEYGRMFTSMFVHFSADHLFNNMILLFFLGDYLERYAGKIRYLLIYLLGGLGGNICSLYLEVRKNESVLSGGASGAVFAVVGAMLVLIVMNKGRLEDLSFRRMAFMAALSIYSGFTSVGVDNAAHIGGFISGILLTLILCTGKFSRLSNRQ